MSYVFLSHSHFDKEFARMIAADLRNAGHTVWIDEAEINVGDSLVKKISKGLEQVDYVAAIISEASVDSEWVARELDIATNREIEEKRVVVLPLLLDNVSLPGFLKGKFYADFRNTEQYDTSLKVLLKSLGDTEITPPSVPEEVERLKAELAAVREMAARESRSAQRASEAAFQGKSKKLKRAIEAANKKFPSHAPINRTYAFEMGNTIVTLDYAMWAVAKSMRQGAHVLEALLTNENRWGDIENMFAAYSEMTARQEN